MFDGIGVVVSVNKPVVVDAVVILLLGVVRIMVVVVVVVVVGIGLVTIYKNK